MAPLLLSCLKGKNDNFTHEGQATCHCEDCSTCENSCIMSSVALGTFPKKETAVLMVSSGLRLCCAPVWFERSCHCRSCWVHCVNSTVQDFGRWIQGWFEMLYICMNLMHEWLNCSLTFLLVQYFLLRYYVKLYTWTSEPLLRNALLDWYITKLVFHIDVHHLCEQHEKKQAITLKSLYCETKSFCFTTHNTHFAIPLIDNESAQCVKVFIAL